MSIQQRLIDADLGGKGLPRSTERVLLLVQDEINSVMADADPNAVHVNVDSEISGVASKASPVGADKILIEDSESGDEKRSVTAQSVANLAPAPAHADTTGQGADDHHSQVHDLAGSDHNAATLAELNAKISDANVDAAGTARPPNGSAGGQLGGSYPNPTVNDGADSTAIHDNVDGEIATITEKTAPVLTDTLLIEDDDASAEKKRIQIGNLPYTGQNFLRNGQGLITQNGTSFTAASTPANDDGEVLIDRWALLSDGNDVVDISRETTFVPANAPSCIKLLVATVDAKFGHLQILEKNDTSLGFDDGPASFSFEAARTGSSLVDIRAAIVMFTTSGAPVRDAVSSWNAAGANPTLASDWVFAGTPIALPAVTTSFQKYKIENVTVPAGFSVGVFFWSDETTTTLGDALYFGQLKLEPGPIATPYIPNQRFNEDLIARYYFRKQGKGIRAEAFTTTDIRVSGQFGTAMRVAPTVTMLISNPTFIQGVTGFTGSGSVLSSVSITPRGFSANISGFTSLVVGSSGFIDEDIVFAFDAEI